MATTNGYGDCFLHLEWNPWSKFRTDKDLDGQGLGNSGVFLMRRYEVQILDSFQNETYADGMAGALYAQFAPRVNAARPPGQWQSFDILFHAPRFDDQGQLLAPARKTVFWNGVAVHHDRVLLGDEVEFEVDGREKKELKYVPHPPREPVTLQHHGSGVWFRDLWIQELDTELDLQDAALLRSRHAYALENREFGSKDRKRPQPPVIRPGRDGSPPSDALALVLPSLTQDWTPLTSEGGGEWRETPEGQVLTGAVSTGEGFQNAQVHVAWRAAGDAPETASATITAGGVPILLRGLADAEKSWNTAEILVSLHRWEHQGNRLWQRRVSVFCNDRFIREFAVDGEGEVSEDQWDLRVSDLEGDMLFREIWVRPLTP
jgi:hypothetical protein